MTRPDDATRYLDPTAGDCVTDFEWNRVQEKYSKEDWTVLLSFPRDGLYDLTVGGKKLSAENIDALIRDLHGAKAVFDERNES